jgi:GT2 family glycosyltransferase
MTASPSRTVVFESEAKRPARAVVCVPTFRRPDQLRVTLRSIAEQATDENFAVVIVDNDGGDARVADVAGDFFRASGVPGTLLVERQQGNCFAINAAFEAALASHPEARYFLMIDDDEIATPQWLNAMVTAAEHTDSAIVGGPVYPDMDKIGRQDLARHPAFYPAYERSGPVPMIYGSGNCLIRRDVFLALSAPFFDLRFNYLGGGDTDFFTRARKAGWASYWAAEAVIHETIPLARTRRSWLAQRALRIGAINYSIERKHAAGMTGRFKLLARNAAILPFSAIRALKLILKGDRAAAIHPMLVAVGRCLAAVGIEPHQYQARKI